MEWAWPADLLDSSFSQAFAALRRPDPHIPNLLPDRRPDPTKTRRTEDGDDDADEALDPRQVEAFAMDAAADDDDDDGDGSVDD